jgi:hypothetical protein
MKFFIKTVSLFTIFFLNLSLIDSKNIREYSKKEVKNRYGEPKRKHTFKEKDYEIWIYKVSLMENENLIFYKNKVLFYNVDFSDLTNLNYELAEFEKKIIIDRIKSKQKVYQTLSVMRQEYDLIELEKKRQENLEKNGVVLDTNFLGNKSLKEIEIIKKAYINRVNDKENKLKIRINDSIENENKIQMIKRQKLLNSIKYFLILLSFIILLWVVYRLYKFIINANLFNKIINFIDRKKILGFLIIWSFLLFIFVIKYKLHITDYLLYGVFPFVIFFVYIFLIRNK